MTTSASCAESIVWGAALTAKFGRGGAGVAYIPQRIRSSGGSAPLEPRQSWHQLDALQNYRSVPI